MNVVDSSGWLEYLSDGTQAKHFSPVLSRTDELLVPSITLYEVFKVVLRERGEDDALQDEHFNYLKGVKYFKKQ